MPHEAAAAIAGLRTRFWATAEPAWRLKLDEARRIVVKGGFAALAGNGRPALPDELAARIADRFTAYRDEEMFALSRRA